MSLHIQILVKKSAIVIYIKFLFRLPHCAHGIVNMSYVTKLNPDLQVYLNFSIYVLLLWCWGM